MKRTKLKNDDSGAERMAKTISPSSWWVWLAVVVMWVAHMFGWPFWPAMGWTALGVFLIFAIECFAL